MKKTFLLMLAMAAILTACKPTPNTPEGPGGNNDPVGPGEDPSVITYDFSLIDYDGSLASDAENDIIDRSNTDIYWEGEAEDDGTFANTVTITYSGNSAEVELSDKAKKNISVYQEGAHIALFSKKKCEIILQGSTTDGSLKIYANDTTDTDGKKKVKLTLNGVNIKSMSGPAINYQQGKRMYLHLAEGTTNYLEDGANYSDDIYYLDESIKDDEDRKGCFFSEKAVIVSGTGSLHVTGKHNHAISVDNDFCMRPGSTVVIEAAAKNCLHCNDEIHLLGGLLYAKNTSAGGKGIKTDGTFLMDGGEVIVSTSGTYGRDDNNEQESPKGIKIDQSVTINNGTMIIRCIGKCEGSEGLESKTDIVINGGNIDIMSYDDAINAANSVTINGGNIWCLSKNNDGIDSNGDIYLNGGKITSIAANMEAAYDNDNPGEKTNFFITGGEIVGFGGQVYAPSTNGTTQYTIVYNGCPLTTKDSLYVRDSAGNNVITGYSPQGSQRAGVLLSSSKFQKDAAYDIYVGTTKCQTVTLTKIVTQIGQGGGPGGGGPGGGDGPGGW